MLNYTHQKVIETLAKQYKETKINSFDTSNFDATMKIALKELIDMGCVSVDHDIIQAAHLSDEIIEKLPG